MSVPLIFRTSCCDFCPKSPLEAPLPVANTKLDGKDAYASNDLLEPHPTRKGWWRYYGRVDDQIILSNGEKV